MGGQRHRDLTPREREILALAAGGLSNAVIAARLGLGRETVHGHWKAIYQRLGLTGHLGARRAAIRAWRERVPDA